MSFGTITLHEDPRSGNCYKLKLCMAHLGLPFAVRQYDITKGETRTAEFLGRVNPNGRIPVLEVDGEYLPESNAGLCLLARGTRLWPDERWAHARVLQWLFFEQYSHEPNVATLRFWKTILGHDKLTDAQRALIPGKLAAGEAALRIMDEHLAGRRWFVGQTMTIADIALYAYTHVCDEGGFDLKEFSNVRGWCEALALEPGHVEMAADAAELDAPDGGAGRVG